MNLPFMLAQKPKRPVLGVFNVLQFIEFNNTPKHQYDTSSPQPQNQSSL